MSDPPSGNDRPIRNPPGTGRRARDVAPTSPAASVAATPPVSPAPAPDRAASGLAGKGDRKAPRGMVCPQCGKYFDVSGRPIGHQFDCKCGATLVVPMPRANPVTRPAEQTLKLRDLRTRHRLSMVAMIIAFATCIALLSATLYLLVTERRYNSGTCAGVAAMAFLIVAVVATNEWRRTSAELAAEEVDQTL